MINSFKFLSSFLFPKKTEERKSEVSGKLEVHYANGKYVLDSANVNYSFGGLHTVFQKAFRQFNIKERNVNNVLILGFGSGSVASILQHEYRKEVAITGVEKDEAVIELAKKYFSVDNYKNLKLHCSDAYDFVLKAQGEYNLIVVDIFVDMLSPEKFQDEKFVSALSKLLSNDGILFYNFIAHDEKTRNAGGKLYKQLSRLIGKTEWVRLFAKSTENWVFVIDTQRTAEE
ncbi:MAG: methyltransferase domain-containing protein [Bacteroidetes bacterium]|nr:MAG: methyltransferase domain-containing protein [Bacteroidota bacterium]